MEKGNKEHKSLAKRLLRILLWIIGIWVALLVILQVVLSPKVLERIVDKYAPVFIDADLEYSSIRVNMFRHFPNIGLVIKDLDLTYPTDRFEDYQAAGIQDRMLNEGRSDKADTLASFKHFSVGINIPALISGKIKVPHLRLERPRLFAHSYGEKANWQIFKITGEKDTTQKLPPISIGRVRFVGNPHIVYTDAGDTLFAAIDVKSLTVNGRVDTGKSGKNKAELRFDSLAVTGRMGADTIGLGMDILHIHEHKDHMDIYAEAKAMLATRAFGRMDIPISIKGTADIHKDTVPSLALHGFKAEIATIPILFDLDLSKQKEGLHIDGNFDIANCKVEDIIDDFGKNIISQLAGTKTNASLSVSGTCNGYLRNGDFPDLNISMNIPRSEIKHPDIRHKVSLALEAGLQTTDSGDFDINIKDIEISTYGLYLAASGGIAEFSEGDPLISVDGRFEAAADSLLTFLPEEAGIFADGRATADIKGSIRASQLHIYNFAKAELTGGLESEHLVFKSPNDSIDIDIEELALKIGPQTRVSRRDSSRQFRLISIDGELGKVAVSLKETMKLSGKELKYSASNSVNSLSDTSRVYPLSGKIEAVEFSLEDGAGMSITLDETANNFRMFPKRNQPKVPVLSLVSDNKRIYVRTEHNRFILTDSDIGLKASMNTVERRLKRKAFMDSLALAHPEIHRDSLMSFLRAQRQQRALPEWLREEDFTSADLDFRLEGAIADYFRNWDLEGAVDIRTGIIMTPYMPLRNIIRGLDLNFNNNEIKIDSFKVVSGASELAAKGSLTGLRRALLGRGIYKLDLDLSSDRMDAKELLAAYNTGSLFKPDSQGVQMEGVSDAEFLKMVVTDSLDTEKSNPLVVVPANIIADIKLDAGNISFSDLLISELGADITIKERCMQITDAKAVTNMGAASMEAFYATRSKQNIKTGFNFNLSDVTSEKVIAMMPAIDTLMPLLKSFKGDIDCELAATASLDTSMNIITPSINGIIRIEGENLTMGDNRMFQDLARKLKFRNSSDAKIKKMTVEGMIKDNMLEIFPFVLSLDRYTLAMSGIHNLDMSYRYHASLIHSPMVFKVGIDIYGPDFNNMKFKIGKPKYRNENVPVFSKVIDETKINLAESIRNIFEKGVEKAVLDNEAQTAITEHKENIGYINAADQALVELNTEEMKEFERQRDKSDTQAALDSATIANNINKILEKNKNE